MDDLRAFPCNGKGPDLFNRRLQIDAVQDFDVRWDETLLSASGCVLEGLYTSKNWRSLFSSRLSWLCMNKEPFETVDRQVLYD